jgi:hypothetical protein
VLQINKGTRSAIGRLGDAGAAIEAQSVQVILSSGGWAPSRDESETAVLLVVDRPKL